MKAVLFYLIVSSFLINPIFSQGKKQLRNDSRFKEYLTLFPEMGFPFIATWDYKKRTQFSVPLTAIPKSLYISFICNNGINCKSDYCDSKKFFGFEALCQFPSKDSSIIVIATNDTDAGCDEKWYLISYTPDGHFIDKLWFFGKTYLKLPSKADQSRTYLQIESSVLENEIIMDAKQFDYHGKAKNVSNFHFRFIITEKGKFIKVEGGNVFE